MAYPANKYAGEQHERHGGLLHWPGVNGFPFRGDFAPYLDRNAVEELPTVGDAKHHIFRLNDASDEEWYGWVRDRIRNGWFTQDAKEVLQAKPDEGVVIYLEWTQLYVQLPAKHANGNRQDAAQTHSFTIR